MQLKLHPAQVDILLNLIYQPEAGFSELNTTDLSSDHFSFHVKRLVDTGLVEKTVQGRYRLTREGKEFANRFDTTAGVLEKQDKIGVLICGVKKEGRLKKYLIQQRLKQPYYGFYGFITGKARWGEAVMEVAARELKEETNLDGKLELVGIKHKMDYAKDDEFLEGKYFFVFRATELHGNLVESFEDGRNAWLTEEEIFKLEDLFDGVDESIKMINQAELVFSETKYKVKRY
ncbi:NUDIX domain-containing protein [Patescibacteria group bacterium]|nr:NUDIX domain-containing protein [Patescibacteria group bacterium]MBU1868322.1 NUDIX domain-containing protein [Patescibacteria group bacterium]